MTNMHFPVQELNAAEFPSLLREIPQPPDSLNYRGQLPTNDLSLLAVVGSRHYTNYGRQVVEHLIGGLSGYPIGIVSGLALGIDSLAHQAALDAGLYTLAIPGGGLSDDVIYPATHKPLARQILENKGGLLSEYKPDFRATKWSFPKRNRLVTGIAKATIVIEAGEKSGSLITARLAADYNRELLVVPGSIFSDNSRGTHQFMKLGATPVTEAEDILDVLGLKIKRDGIDIPKPNTSPNEAKVITLLSEPRERDALIRLLDIPVNEAAILLMQMEMNGLLKESNGIYRKV